MWENHTEWGEGTHCPLGMAELREMGQEEGELGMRWTTERETRSIPAQTLSCWGSAGEFQSLNCLSLQKRKLRDDEP